MHMQIKLFHQRKTNKQKKLHFISCIFFGIHTEKVGHNLIPHSGSLWPKELWRGDCMKLHSAGPHWLDRTHSVMQRASTPWLSVWQTTLTSVRRTSYSPSQCFFTSWIVRDLKHLEKLLFVHSAKQVSIPFRTPCSLLTVLNWSWKHHHMSVSMSLSSGHSDQLSDNHVL